MPIFGRTVNGDVLLAIEYATVLLANGHATETILASLASKRFGAVTRETGSILESIRKGKSAEDAFDRAIQRVRHKWLQQFLIILRAPPGTDAARRFAELSDRIISDAALQTDTLMDALRANLNRIFLLMAVPLSIFFLALLQDALTLAEIGFSVSPIANLAIVAADLAVMLLLISRLRWSA